MYRNGNLNATWREVRKQSRAWRARDKKILELVHRTMAGPDGTIQEFRHDIDPNCTCIIATDMIESKKQSGFDSGPCNTLVTNLVRYLGSTLPSLTIKTAASNKSRLGADDPTALDLALDAAQAGSPVLFLDVRERPLVEAADRVALIDATKAAFEEHCDALLAVGLAESFDISSIAYFYNALVGTPVIDIASDGASKRRSVSSVEGASSDMRVALHEAITFTSSEGAGRTYAGAQGMKRATPEQAGQLAT